MEKQEFNELDFLLGLVNVEEVLTELVPESEKVIDMMSTASSKLLTKWVFEYFNTCKIAPKKEGLMGILMTKLPTLNYEDSAGMKLLILSMIKKANNTDYSDETSFQTRQGF